MVTTEKAFLTPPEIATLLGIDHAKVMHWIRTGELPAVDVSTARLKRPRFKVARGDFEHFLKRRSTRPEQQPSARTRRDSDGDNYY